MPDRMIRDELLRSPRYRTLSSDTARLLFLHLLLHVDNLGNFEAHPIAIADVLRRPIEPESVAKLLAEFADVDLIRLYADRSGKQYLHIPRFRQRMKYLGSKYPRPPVEIECPEIRELVEKYRLKAAHSQLIGSRSANEEKRREVKPKPSREPDGFALFWGAYPRRVAKGAAIKAWAKLAPDQELAQTILTAIQRQRKTEEWTKDGGKFIPYPASWLNGRRWEDEIPYRYDPADPRDRNGKKIVAL